MQYLRIKKNKRQIAIHKNNLFIDNPNTCPSCILKNIINSADNKKIDKRHIDQ